MWEARGEETKPSRDPALVITPPELNDKIPITC